MSNTTSIERLFLGAVALIVAGLLFGAKYSVAGTVIAVAGITFCARDFVQMVKTSQRQKQQIQVRRNLVAASISKLQKNPTPTSAQIRQLGNLAAPADYRDFLLISNGGHGLLTDNSRLELWTIEAMRAENQDWKNRAIEEASRTYGLFFFATNDRGIKYAFRIRDNKIVIVAVTDGGQLTDIANTFVGFITNLGLK